MLWSPAKPQRCLLNHSGLISQGAFPLSASVPSGYVDRISPLWQERASTRAMDADTLEDGGHNSSMTLSKSHRGNLQASRLY